MNNNILREIQKGIHKIAKQIERGCTLQIASCKSDFRQRQYGNLHLGAHKHESQLNETVKIITFNFFI